MSNLGVLRGVCHALRDQLPSVTLDDAVDVPDVGT